MYARLISLNHKLYQTTFTNGGETNGGEWTNLRSPSSILPTSWSLSLSPTTSLPNDPSPTGQTRYRVHELFLHPHTNNYAEIWWRRRQGRLLATIERARPRSSAKRPSASLMARLPDLILAKFSNRHYSHSHYAPITLSSSSPLSPRREYSQTYLANSL